MKNWLLVALSFALAHGVLGCMPLMYSMKSEADWKKVSTKEVCLAWYEWGTDGAEKELRRRNVFNGTDWALIKSKRVGIGMNADAVYCSWGIPNRENQPSLYRPVQMVFGGGYSRQYVYVRDGYVVDMGH